MPDGLAADDTRLESSLAWTTIVAAFVDSLMTYAGVRFLGAVEGSPVVAGLVRTLGLEAGLAVRTLIALALLGALWWGLQVRALRRFGLTALALVNVAVIGWNLQIMWPSTTS